jgi:hypothetical protein
MQLAQLFCGLFLNCKWNLTTFWYTARDTAITWPRFNASWWAMVNFTGKQIPIYSAVQTEQKCGSSNWILRCSTWVSGSVKPYGWWGQFYSLSKWWVIPIYGTCSCFYTWQAGRLNVIRFRKLICLSFNCTDLFNIFILIFNLISFLYLLQVVSLVYFMMLSQLTLDGTEYDNKWKNYWNTCARKQSFPDILFQHFLFMYLFIRLFIWDTN